MGSSEIGTPCWKSDTEASLEGDVLPRRDNEAAQGFKPVFICLRYWIPFQAAVAIALHLLEFREARSESFSNKQDHTMQWRNASEDCYGSNVNSPAGIDPKLLQPFILSVWRLESWPKSTMDHAL